ncbi:YfcE family phosphodiesterase [Roseateles chitinivorans]|uniref:YfcE family phosphodiesterase n=1 Tax=Roseateles chitinivorans TaxID=2917965 RepID=A0A2G9C4Z3_9BURK|nr:metallophosphoesterase family protein [Roseateles chitinivorans]PIM51457.1 YfcE family phosphodiesterase [Roseateles chitinivorans]
MRIALLSDIHGNLPALEAVVADLRPRGVDTIVNLGDILSGPLLPLETARYLMAQRWITIAGNHERQLLAITAEKPGGASDRFARECLGEPELDWLRALPTTLRLNDEVFLCHGTPRRDIEYFLDSQVGERLVLASAEEVAERLGEERSELVCCGHTHIPRVLRSSRGQWLVNPGSVGLQAWDDEHPAPHVAEVGSPDARYAIVEKTAQGWRTTSISVPYDHEAAARIAARHGREDWARWLRTGYAAA